MSARTLTAPSPASQAAQPRSAQRQYSLLRTVIALVLIGAALLKAYQAATEPVDGRLWMITQVELELLLGMGLISGLCRRAGWWVTVLCFGAFAAVATYKACQGAASCGCFGKLQVNPWHTAGLDLVILAALLLCRPTLRPSQAPAKRLKLKVAILMAATGILGTVAAIAMASYQPGRLQADSEILGDSRYVLLEPSHWIGKPFPLVKHIDSAAPLMQDKWMVVFYHHDCPYCQEMFQKLDGLAMRLAAERENAKLATIQLPPYGQIKADSLKGASLTGRLSDSRHWLMNTPTIVWLDHGKVTRVQEDSTSPATMLPADLSSMTITRVPASDATCDLGFVEPGSVHKIVFSVPNPSPKDWIIRKVVSECRCTIVRDAPTMIAAGHSAELTVVLAVPKEPQLYAKSVTLAVAEPGVEPVVRQIRARIGLPLEVRPQSTESPLAPEADGQMRFVITNQGKAPVRILYGTSTNIACSVIVPSAAIPPNGTAEVAVRSTGNAPASHSSATTIHLHTDHPVQSELEFTVGKIATR